MRGRSEPLVKEDEFGKARIACNAQNFKSTSLNFDFAELASWRDLAHEIEMAAGALFPLISNACRLFCMFFERCVLHQSFKIS